LAGIYLRPCWGAYSSPPDQTFAEFKGPNSRGKKGKGRKKGVGRKERDTPPHREILAMSMNTV